MTLKVKRIIIALLGATFLASLLFVQWMEVIRKKEEAGLIPPHVVEPADSLSCIKCHAEETPGIVEQWRHSTHAEKGVACFHCHKAEPGDADGYNHKGAFIATLVTPRDCSRCHEHEFNEFTASHHAKAGNILHSLDNKLAEIVEGAREPFNPHSPTPGMNVKEVVGLAFAYTGCQQCHGSKVALLSTDGENITVDDLKPGADGKPTNLAAVERIRKNEDGKPLFYQETWPNTGMGRLNLDGSRGACSACHSRHDFSPRRARQPENCGKCHLGPDHPQKEIYEESKHGVAYRDLKAHMNLDADEWVLGKDYSQAPTCATCHMSANLRDNKITHDPGERLSWTNRPYISRVMDTDKDGNVITETDPAKRKALLAEPGAESATVKRDRMKNVCSHCHSPDYINGFYAQYDNFIILYNEKFGKPGKAIMDELKKQGLLTPTPFDEEIEWTWFYLWHHEGRRARHGASMMAPDYAHWHGSFEVADRFYMGLVPQAREIVHRAEAEGKTAEAKAVNDVIEEILSRPENAWFEKGKKADKASAEDPRQPAKKADKSAPEQAEETSQETDAAPSEENGELRQSAGNLPCGTGLEVHASREFG